MYMLGLEKAKEPEIKLPTFLRSQRKPGNSRKIYFCFNDYTKSFDCVYHNKLWEIHRDGNSRPPIWLLRNLYAGQEETELDMKQQNGSNLGKKYNKAVCCHPAYLSYMQST